MDKVKAIKSFTRRRLGCWSRYRRSRTCSWEDASSQLGGRFFQGNNGSNAPCLDLRPRDTIHGPDVLASRAVPRADGLGATVVGVRGDADHEWRPCPDIVAIHKAIVLLDVSLHEPTSANLDSMLLLLDIFSQSQPASLPSRGIVVKRTNYHRIASTTSGWCSRGPLYRGRRGLKAEFRVKYWCNRRMNWQT